MTLTSLILSTTVSASLLDLGFLCHNSISYDFGFNLEFNWPIEFIIPYKYFPYSFYIVVKQLYWLLALNFTLLLKVI